MLARRRHPARLIPLTPLVDVFLILLIFFMVTSSFLNLDTIPAMQGDEARQTAANPTAEAAPALVRVAPDGRAVYRGQSLSAEDLAVALAQAPEGLSSRRILILPSARAPMQALVSVIDSLTLAGAGSVQVVQLEAGQ